MKGAKAPGKGMTVMTDRQIIELFFARNESAIEETDKKYGSYCRTISMNILKDARDCEEAVNDAYLKAWDSIPPAEPDPLKTYIGMLSRRVSLNRYRYFRAQKRNASFDGLLSEAWEMIPDGRDRFSEGEISKAVNAFLKELKKESRIFFVRRYWYADSIEDIAALCGCGQSKVKSSLARTRKALRKYLEKEGIKI